jgi:hypothetical protein
MGESSFFERNSGYGLGEFFRRHVGGKETAAVGEAGATRTVTLICVFALITQPLFSHFADLTQFYS